MMKLKMVNAACLPAPNAPVHWLFRYCGYGYSSNPERAFGSNSQRTHHNVYHALDGHFCSLIS